MNSNKKGLYALFILAILILAQLSGCSGQDVSPVVAISTLTITGDVRNQISLVDYGEWQTQSVSYRDKTEQVIPLLPILSEAGITGTGASVFFSSPDGAMAEMPLEQIGETCYLRLSNEYGWQLIAPEHPKQSGIKFMDYVVVATTEPGLKESCVRIIDGLNETMLTYGQLFAAEAVSKTVFEGEAKMNQLSTGVYNRRTLIPISNYLTDDTNRRFSTGVAYYADGSQGEVMLSGFLEWRGNTADYIGPNGKDRKKDILGIWADGPELCVTHMAPKALKALEENRVLMILLDGLSYYDVMELKPAYLWGKGPMPARTVMPSITPVCLSSIVTGEYPSVTGIHSRDTRQVKTDDIFSKADEMGKTCAMVCGFAKTIDISIDPILNPDLNGENDTDDEVFACGKEQIDDQKDLVFVHFKGYDEKAHTYGPLSPEASQKLEQLDSYVEGLCRDFSGTVFIIADHGQHRIEGDKLGEHGEFRLTDMTVPWIEFSPVTIP